MSNPEIIISPGDKCADCPILNYCQSQIDKIKELPDSQENKAHINSYVNFFNGIHGECNDGPDISESRQLFFGKSVTKISCGSSLSRLHQDIKSRTLP